MVIRIMIGVCCLLLGACSSSLPANEYIKWHNDRSSDNWFFASDEAFEYALQYRPVTFQALMSSATLDKEQINGLLKENEGADFYLLHLKALDEGFEFPKMGDPKRNYLEYRFNSDVKLNIGTVQYPCETYVFEPSHNLKPECGFLISFGIGSQNTGGSADKTLRFMSPFTGKLVQIDILSEKLKKLPKLKY